MQVFELCINTWSAQYSLQCPKCVLQLVISVQLTLLHLVYNTHHKQHSSISHSGIETALEVCYKRLLSVPEGTSDHCMSVENTIMWCDKHCTLLQV